MTPFHNCLLDFQQTRVIVHTLDVFMIYGQTLGHSNHDVLQLAMSNRLLSRGSKYSAQDANYLLNVLYCIVVDEGDSYNAVSGIQLGHRIDDKAVCVKMAKADTNLWCREIRNTTFDQENETTHIALLVKLSYNVLALDCTLTGDHEGHGWDPRQVDRARSNETNAPIVLLLACEEGEQRLQETLFVLRNGSKGRFQVVFGCER